VRTHPGAPKAPIEETCPGAAQDSVVRTRPGAPKAHVEETRPGEAQDSEV
jgi:hypothetical protein